MLEQAAGRFRTLSPQLRQVLAKPFVIRREEVAAPHAGMDVGSAGFTAWFSQSRAEILRAQRFRYQVFSAEYGAGMPGIFGLDRDRFDRHCLHLMVRDNRTGRLVGYTRILTDEGMRRCGGYYSETEFEMAMVEALPGRVAEVGRTCIHPDYRNGAVISALWSRLGQFMADAGIHYLIGCASVALHGEYDAGAIIARIRESHLSPPALRVRPRMPARELPVPGRAADTVRMPPLLKAYLRMGARICGEPCEDRDFNCLDFFVLLSVEDMPRRYAQHFFRPSAITA